ncbi:MULTISPECIES: hypothetical protein [Sphingomonas]|uniref:hypothetical protein n=1 Tax=Sphingomonas TaxID=13687 RepID=UPI00082E650E|nr:hypothetical protein [Sphingomonas sp. CCH10-B3]
MADEMLTPLPKAAAATDRPGPGEQAARARERFHRNYLLAAAAFGGVIGGVLAVSTPGTRYALFALAQGELKLDPLFAIVIAIAVLIGLGALPAYGFRTIDEVKVQRNLWSMTAGWFVVVAGYPVWVVLAAGGLLPRPSAVALFLCTYGATMIAYSVLWLRDRG